MLRCKCDAFTHYVCNHWEHNTQLPTGDLLVKAAEKGAVHGVLSGQGLVIYAASAQLRM